MRNDITYDMLKGEPYEQIAFQVVEYTHPEDWHKQNATYIVDFALEKIKDKFEAQIDGRLIYGADYKHDQNVFLYTAPASIKAAMNEEIKGAMIVEYDEGKGYKLKYHPDFVVTFRENTPNEPIMYGWVHPPPGKIVDEVYLQPTLMAHLNKISLTLTTITPKYNKSDNTFENSYRFQFKVTDNVTANGLMTYTGQNPPKPFYLEGMAMPIVLGKEFMEGYGLHAPCARFLPEHVRATRGTFFPPHTTCTCDKRAEQRSLEKAKRAAKESAVVLYKRRKSDKIAQSAGGSSSLFR